MSDPRKPVFDAIRNEQPILPAHVAIVDKALDDIDFPRAGGTGVWIALAVPLMHEFEGYADKQPDGSVKAYPDPATGGKPWTIGWGSTTDEQGNPIVPGTIWSRDRAERRFEMDLAAFSSKVRALLTAPTSDSQFAAMVSLAYNIGMGNFQSSTLLRKHNAGDYAGAKAQFAVWNKANKKVMAGLTRRRAAEASLYGAG